MAEIQIQAQQLSGIMMASWFSADLRDSREENVHRDLSLGALMDR